MVIYGHFDAFSSFYFIFLEISENFSISVYQLDFVTEDLCGQQQDVDRTYVRAQKDLSSAKKQRSEGKTDGE